VNALEVMAKAMQAAASAKVLVDIGDADGACNRAYYAMFDAARAALLASGHTVGKTHHGVLLAFSEHWVKNGPLTKDTGRLLKHAEHFRLLADYTGDLVELDDARTLVKQAQDFVIDIRRRIMSDAQTNQPP